MQLIRQEAFMEVDRKLLDRQITYLELLLGKLTKIKERWLRSGRSSIH